MKNYLPKIIFVLIIGGLLYANYILRNATDSETVAHLFTRSLEKKEQKKEILDNEERIYELQRDLDEIVQSMEDHAALSTKISTANQVIFASILLAIIALYLINKEKIRNE